MCPLLAPQLQHVGKHVPLSLLTTYSVSTLSKDSTPMWGAYWLIYPCGRWGYSYWLGYNERRYRGTYSEVTPYTKTNAQFGYLPRNTFVLFQ